MRDGIAALLEHSFDDADNSRVFERDTLIDFLLLDGRQKQSDGRKPGSITGTQFGQQTGLDRKSVV